MSQRLISHSPDLAQLQEEGYEIDVQAGNLVIRHVPYVDAEGAVKFGTMMCPLALENDRTAQPDQHTMMFDGQRPYDASGTQLMIVAEERHQDLGEGLSFEFTFSRMPKVADSRYSDYHSKVTTYVEFLGRHARDVDPEATARTYKHIPVSDEEPSVFRYLDNASARAEIQLVTDKLKAAGPIAIVGLGGTGTYILDLVAKTPVNEIHVYDGDRFSQHNAFRSPGAPAGTDLDGAPPKVEYFGAIYDHMHSGMRTHHCYIDDGNVDELAAMQFVFIAVDDGRARRLIADRLEAAGVPFVDVGMGLYEFDAALGGQARITTSTEQTRDLVRGRLPMRDTDPANDYRTNIQIADLNALNATLAVIKWKKLVGFYQDTDFEHHTIYKLGGNRLINEDSYEPTS